MAATLAHCAYCFESLVRELNHQAPTTLGQVEDQWKNYYMNGQKAAAPSPSPSQSLLHVPVSNSSSSSSSASTQSGSTSSTPPSSAAASSATSQVPSSEDELPIKSSRLFVTWNQRPRGSSSPDEYELRGCIGTFTPYDLDEGLNRFALVSALEDTRFEAITSDELSTLQCCVTLLTEPEPIADPMDWTVGEHGVSIEFVHNRRRYGATYLPNIALEQGWSKDDTLNSLIRKAGVALGRGQNWTSVSGLKVKRYEGKKELLTYAQWRAFREWLNASSSSSGFASSEIG